MEDADHRREMGRRGRELVVEIFPGADGRRG